MKKSNNFTDKQLKTEGSKIVTMGKWEIDLFVDVDGHLSIGINHDDETLVQEINEDITANDNEWAARFTTLGIEKKYIESFK